MSTTKNKTAIGYLRVSSVGQANGTSLDSQKESIENLCMAKGILLLRFYIDKFSGKNFNRPEFKKAYQFLEDNRGDIDMFLTKRIDRFTRDTQTGLEAISKINKLGVEVNYVDDWIEDTKSPQAGMITTIKMAVSEYERKVISERCRLGEKKALRNGRYIFSPPIGYERTVLDNGKKGMKPSEYYSLVKELFEDYSKGIYSQLELVNKYKQKGLKISKSSISLLLDNVLYAGLVDLNKYKIHPYKKVKGLHKAIISEELFYKVQSIKDGKNRMIKKIRPKNSKFPLSALMTCANCGSPMYGSTSNNGKSKKITREYSFYRCKNNCKGQSYKPIIVHKELLNILSKVTPSPNIVRLYKTILIEGYEDSKSKNIQVVKKINRNIRDKEQMQLKLTEKYAVGKIQEDIYKKTIQNINIVLNELQVEKSKYGDSKKGLDKYLMFGMSLLMNLDTTYDKAPIDVKIQLLGSYFTGNLIFENKNFRTLPFNPIIELMSRYNKDFDSLQKKTGEYFSINSCSVLEAGLEPART